MDYVMYIRQNKEISFDEQLKQCNEFVKKHNHFIAYKVIDLKGDKFYEALNKVVVEHDVAGLLIYNEDATFENKRDHLFYRMYIEKLGKEIVSCV